MEYRVSVLQYEPRLLEPARNLELAGNLLRDLDTDLVVLPELCFSGYVFTSPDEVGRIAESIPEGKCFQALRDIAMARDFSIVYGFAESADGKCFNSSALINPDGSHQVYRKTHLFFREKLFFEPGDTGFSVHPAKKEVRVGMMVCFDWIFPEAMRSLALQGAQIVCHPANLVLPWCQQAMITRCLENRVFSITSNRIGLETNGDLSENFTGQSQILGTKGEILVRLGENDSGVHTVVIDPDLALDKNATAQNHIFHDRRPELYTL